MTQPAVSENHASPQNLENDQAPTPQAAASVTIHCQGILFDMDGILISSLGSVERSWTTWALARNLDPAHTIHCAHGCRAIETIRRLRPDLDDEAELKYLEDLEVGDNDGLAVLPGVQSLLSSLPPERWTVVTSATERLARVRMAEGGIPVPPQIITADHVTSGKPHPEPYERGATILGFPPSACVVFEDSASGAKAGHAAGCTVIGTLFSHKLEELTGAHYIVTDVTGITVEVVPNGLVLRFAPFAIQL